MIIESHGKELRVGSANSGHSRLRCPKEVLRHISLAWMIGITNDMTGCVLVSSEAIRISGQRSKIMNDSVRRPEGSALGSVRVRGVANDLAAVIYGVGHCYRSAKAWQRLDACIQGPRKAGSRGTVVLMRLPDDFTVVIQ